MRKRISGPLIIVQKRKTEFERFPLHAVRRITGSPQNPAGTPLTAIMPLGEVVAHIESDWKTFRGAVNGTDADFRRIQAIACRCKCSYEPLLASLGRSCSAGHARQIVNYALLFGA